MFVPDFAWKWIYSALVFSVLLLFADTGFALGCGNTITENTTLNSSLVNCGGYGLVVGADNIVLDCNGYAIRGGFIAFGGVYLNGRTGVTVKNCVISGFNRGIYLSSSGSNNLLNNTLSGNTYGLYLSASSNANNIQYNSMSANNYGGITIDSSNSNSVLNNIVSGNIFNGVSLISSNSNIINNDRIYGNIKYDISSSLSSGNDFTNNFFGGALGCANKSLFDGVSLSQLNPYYADYAMTTTDSAPTVCPVVCGDSISENTVLTEDLLNCGGMGIVIGADNIILNCDGHSITGTGLAGIYLNGKNAVTVENCVVSGFNNGVYLGLSSFNNILNNTLTGNLYHGISMSLSSNYNYIQNNTLTGNAADGISIYGSNYNKVLHNTMAGNSNNGVTLYDSDFNAVNYDKIYTNGAYDIASTISSGNDLSLDYFGGVLTCERKSLFSGISLSSLDPYYTDEAMTTTGTAPSNCQPMCGETIMDSVTLTKDLAGCPGNGLVIGADDIVLDCGGYSINGSGYAGVLLSGRTGVTVKNCEVSGFANGILLTGSSSNNVSYNKLRSNRYGVSLDSSSDSNIIGNNGLKGNDYGIFLNTHCEANTLSNNIVAESAKNGLYVYFSSSNTVNSNQFCFSNGEDIYTESSSNSGTGNSCDRPDGWNDAGVSGCTNSCDRCPDSAGTIQGCDCGVDVLVTGAKGEPISNAEVRIFDWTNPASCAATARPNNEEFQCPYFNRCFTNRSGQCSTMGVQCARLYDIGVKNPSIEGKGFGWHSLGNVTKETKFAKISLPLTEELNPLIDAPLFIVLAVLVFGAVLFNDYLRNRKSRKK